MPVFDFSSIPENEKKQDPVCTYTMFRSNEAAACLLYTSPSPRDS